MVTLQRSNGQKYLRRAGVRKTQGMIGEGVQRAAAVGLGGDQLVPDGLAGCVEREGSGREDGTVHCAPRPPSSPRPS